MHNVTKGNIEFESAYLPIGVPTFDLEAADVEFKKSIETLKSIDGNIKTPKEMLLSISKLNDFLSTLSPDILIVQNITFANAAYITEIIKRFDCPILLWTLNEPVIDGGRLRLNSLTGAFSAGNTMMMTGKTFDYVYGAAAEESVKKRISDIIDAAKLKKALKNLTLLQIGHTPEGFGFGRADDREILKTFGVILKSIESREMINRARAYSAEEAEEYLNDAKIRIKGLDKINEKNNIDFAKLYKAYKEYCDENDIGALASRCWPDFFTDYGTPVCSVLAMMNDLGVPSACEADAYGALTMYVSYFLTEKASFFGDPVSLNRDENTITFWHCGMGACSLADEATGACAGVHCNRKIGPTLEFACKASKEATVIRIGKDKNGAFRIFLSSGEILKKDKQFSGTSVVFRPVNNAENIVNQAVEDGWEPHFAVSYGDIVASIKSFGKMLGIEVIEY